ncbi:alkaline phosphatase [Steroidobacter agaridevorans]|uniref:Alkaline phosphatase n=1 Tax=Steroidobacter agaridevorans TaxID=2695856 RepID=A0A829YFK2_9GAMM|nr:alkaline phosphatase D family protein [Steroidobacter agaridevorans]GFE82117.1 alkaline phosphatase [Steroidobacter agaridevorans]GFE85495.1 alkaline phosphatase [Steroidobacter agaridevorans]
MRMTRRELVAGLGVAGATLLSPLRLNAQGFDVTPFQLGVASGDPSPDGFVLWTRLAPFPLEPHGGMPRRAVEVAWEVGSDERLRGIVARGTAIAHPELAHSVHVEVAGLTADRPYWYRFSAFGERSFVGRTRTAPLAGAPVKSLRFGVAGCHHYEEGYFHAFRALADADLDFLFHYGDYIYEYPPAPPLRILREVQFSPVRRHLGGETYGLDDYRLRYAQYRTDPDLQRAHAATPWFVTFDDHEVANNWAGDRDEKGTSPEIFALRRAAAFQAWYEHMPVRKASFPGRDGARIYRGATWGDLLSANFLDTRQYRSDQACGDGDRVLCPEALKPGRTMLGADQERWLFERLARSGTRWNVIAQQMLMMDLDLSRAPDARAPLASMDTWGGYPAARDRLLKHLQERKLNNTIVLSGDAHQHFAGDVLRTPEGAPVAAEFLVTSATSGGDGLGVLPGNERILQRNPSLRMLEDRRGYGICEVTQDRWTAELVSLSQVTSTETPSSTVTRFVVEPRRAGIVDRDTRS